MSLEKGVIGFEMKMQGMWFDPSMKRRIRELIGRRSLPVSDVKDFNSNQGQGSEFTDKQADAPCLAGTAGLALIAGGGGYDHRYGRQIKARLSLAVLASGPLCPEREFVIDFTKQHQQTGKETTGQDAHDQAQGGANSPTITSNVAQVDERKNGKQERHPDRNDDPDIIPLER